MNPELRRNLWLEFSLHRMIAVPAVIVLIALLIIASDDKNVTRSLAMAAAGGYGAIVLLWGTRLAAASVLDEARERTWDAQRMSAITPWAMTWGKLLGAPSFTWYGGAILLAIFMFSGNLANLPVLRYTALLLCGAILLHAMALNASVMAAKKTVARRSASTLFLLVLVFLWLVPGLNVLDSMDKTVAWWGLTILQLNFALGTTAAFGAWAVLGAYRSMCDELEIRTTPWALPAFLLCTAAYVAGFTKGELHSGGPSPFFAVTAVGVVVAMVFIYALLFAEKSGAAVWQRLRVRVAAKQWHRALQELPLWLVALVMGLALALVASVSGGKETADTFKIGTAPIALILFAVRDAAIFQFFALAKQPRRVEAATLFYLILLYGLLPGLLKVSGADAVAQFIFPPLSKNALFATAVLAVHAAIAVSLTVWRWRTIHAPDT
ncbi:MAG: hypothetical protein ABL891_23620, partial [Burkholderiales bacterium]